MPKTSDNFDRWEIVFVSAVFLIGLAIRIHLATVNYLNPDEVEVTLDALGNLRQTLHNALTITHPPLLEVILFVVCKFSRAELALRLVPVLAGSLFPLLLFFWLRRLAGSVPAMTVMFLLTLSPYPIALSVQVRCYTLALFFVAASLLVLEEAIEGGRWQMMALFSVLLWFCIVADYSTAWFVGAVGVFVLLRFRQLSAPIKAVWAAGQLGALLLYAALYLIQVRRYRGDNKVALDAVDGWLRNEFPQPGQGLVFPLTHTLGQFEFLVASTWIGRFAFVLFAAALFLLWTGRTRIEQTKARALVALLVLPFMLALAASYARQFPYGATRHTIVIGLFAAIGIGVFLGTLQRRVAIPLVWGMLLLAPLWSRIPLREDIASYRHQKGQILQCLDYMRATIPPGSLIFTERETLNILAYYAGHNEFPPWPGAGEYFSENLLAGRWRVAARDYEYGTPAAYRAALAEFRRQYGLKDSDPVWVLDGGWAIVAGPLDEKLPFTMAVRVFRTGS